MKLLPRAELLACALLVLGLGALLVPGMVAGGSPRLDDVVRTSGGLGLYAYRFGTMDVSAGGVLLSETPLDEGQRVNIRMTQPPGPYWIGKVFVYDNGTAGVSICSPEPTERWGDLYLFGDPELIERIAEEM